MIEKQRQNDLLGKEIAEENKNTSPVQLNDEELDQAVGGLENVQLVDMCRKTYVVGICHGPLALGAMCPHLKVIQQETLRLLMVRMHYKCDKGYFNDVHCDIGI